MEAHPFERAALTLNEADGRVLAAMDAAARALGYAPRFSIGKSERYRAAYVRKKPVKTLLVMTIRENALTLICKLYGLPGYTDAIDQLTDAARAQLFAAGKCRMDAGGCLGPVRFEKDGAQYAFCRHAFVFSGLADADLPGLISMLRREADG
jgi:hypothetical protein